MRGAWILCLMMVSGCATGGPASTRGPQSVGVAFEPEAVQWASAKGSNKILGNALLRTRGGEVRTCAGYKVYLSPAVAYSAARMRLIYGSDQQGYRPAQRNPNLEARPAAYEALIRQTVCDAQGNFQFEELPDGEYFVTTDVIWEVPGRYVTSAQGGGLMLKVAVKGGQTIRPVLTI